MKDLNLPKLSSEERKQIWDNLKPNDILVSIELTKWGNEYYIQYFKIIRKTSKGSLRLDNGELITAFYSNLYLLTDELKECIRKIELEKELFHLFYEIDTNKKSFKANLNYENAVNLKCIIEKILNK